MRNVHEITRMFEEELCNYTGAKYALAVDNCSNALYLCMMYCDVKDKYVHIPSHTYVSLPNEIINAGGEVKFYDSPRYLTGAYQLAPFPIYDSALRFTANQYEAGTFQCVSFTGAYKHLKLGKGGAILLDNEDAYNWLKRARNSGRNEVSYHVDNFEQIGINCYMHPSVAALGLQLMQQFYDVETGDKLSNPDKSLPYPDLSKFPVYQQ